MNKSRRVAVIGSGISGAVAAWLLRDQVDVTLLESAERFGGHTHTVRVDEGDRELAVDTGFMVFNRENYPLLCALFEHLGIGSYPTDMSFSASLADSGLEYAGTDLNGLFGQRRNLINGRYWRLLANVLRFNRLARRTLQYPPHAHVTLGEFLDLNNFNDAFRDWYLYPMAAAIWSCPRGQIAAFPALSFLRFFANHGLIQLQDRPQWMTVSGGSSSYMQRLISDLGPAARCAKPVVSVGRHLDGAMLTYADGSRERFDAVVLACHSDQALRLIVDPSPAERRLLGAIPYQPNRVLLHTDDALMPRQRRVWSSWNYRSEQRGDAGHAVSVTYWMNSLQRLDSRRNYFVSLNPTQEPREEKVVEEFEYHHPLFSTEALQAQTQLHQIQGRRQTWFAGAWTGYGFHEDGMRSGVEVAQALGATVPWVDQIERSRGLSMAPVLVGQAA
jgi:predicted NAD/FAD-binding protein